jgi:hypothetical protein
MAKKKKVGGGEPKAPKVNAGAPKMEQAAGGMGDWDKKFQGSYDSAGDYSQNNPFSQAAQGYVQDSLSGGMGNNPFMQDIYSQTQGQGQQEGLDYLRSFLGGSPGNGPNTGGASSGSSGNKGYRGGSGSVQGGSSYRGGGSGGGSNNISTNRGNIPDSTVGSGFFSKQINELFDPSRLDPANDPTIKPMIDAYQNESQESYYRGLNDLVNSAEAGGRFGSGMYSAQRSQAQDEYSEANNQQLAQIYGNARDRAIANQMEALGLVNNRDISEGQIAAQRDASSSAASSAAAGIRAQENMHNQDLQLQGIQQMLQSGQFNMGLQGQMGSLMSQNQLGAMQAGLGYGQLGMSGFDAQQGFGNLGLQANQGIAGIGQYQDQSFQQQQQAAAANRLRQQQMQFQQDRYNDQAPFDMIDRLTKSMQGLNTMGGYEMDPGYVPSSAGAGNGGFNFDDFMGGALAGGSAYYRGGQ